MLATGYHRSIVKLTQVSS